MRNIKRGFTVIELLVVLAIIGILAGLILGASGEARKRALITKARASISSVETALGMFQSDLGGYPSSGNANLINALSENSGTYVIGTQSYALPTTDWSGPYMNFQTNEISGGQFIDPWNNPYGYTNPGTNHGIGADYGKYVDIWSTGPNAIDEHTSSPKPGDDVTNWRR
ncbi:MAG: type II secretion system protein GspG [Candidatus Omnitrophota bacterium]|nr:type II secretion system protein GspG [Candidatus Omnitrophota bacterium]